MRAKPVTIRGRNYTSIRAAAAALGVHPNAVRKAARRGTLDHVGEGPQRKPTTGKGVTFPSQVAATRYLGLSQTGMNSAVARGRIATACITKQAERIARLRRELVALHEERLAPQMLARAKAEEPQRRGRQAREKLTTPKPLCPVCGKAMVGEAEAHRACRAAAKGVALAAE